MILMMMMGKKKGERNYKYISLTRHEMGRETALGLQIQHGVLAMEMEYGNGEDERQYILEHLRIWLLVHTHTC